MIAFVLLFGCATFATVGAQKMYGSVYLVGREIGGFKPIIDKSAAAFGVFEQTSHQNGWGQLNIETNAALSAHDQGFAAGYLVCVFFFSENVCNWSTKKKIMLLLVI
jgi:hypothetical protein